MSIRAKTCLALFLALLLLSGPGANAQNSEFGTSAPNYRTDQPTGPVWKMVRVVDTFGWQHVDVTINWIGQGTALMIRRQDGASKYFAANQILHIYDAEGNDISDEVGAASQEGNQPGLPPEFVPAESGTSDSAAGSSLADLTTPIPQLFSFSIDAAFGYATHAGTWFSGLDDGFNYQAGLRIAVDKKKYFRFIFRRQDLGQESQHYYLGTDPYGNDLDGTVTIDISLREYQFLAGALKYVQHTNGVNTTGYFEYGLSIMDHRFETKDLGGALETMTKLGVVAQGGLLVRLNNVLALDLSAGVTWKSGFGEDEAGGLLMSARCGLSVLY